ncbi:MAG: glucokinase [Pseudomonadota bacterium]
MTASLPETSVSAATRFDTPRLLADVGGTNARFALETAPGQFEAVQVLAGDDYATLADAIRTYLAASELAALGEVKHASIAIANPVDGDQIRMTNHHWHFSIEGMRQELGFATLLVVNDFYALARSLPHLQDGDKVQVGGGTAHPNAPLALIGAGTGLGVSGLIPAGNSWTALSGEGGHVGFSPANELEVAVLQFAWREFEHVSAERFLSGAGVELIYRALAHQHGQQPEAIDAPEISRRALSGECPLATEVLEVFCGMLGCAAGNLALTLGARGGVYIGGGIVPRLGERFAQSCFRARFERKGRFSSYLSDVPTYVITAQYPAFLGVSAILAEKLSA